MEVPRRPAQGRLDRGLLSGSLLRAMSVPIPCPSCGVPMVVSDLDHEKYVECSRCKESFRVVITLVSPVSLAAADSPAPADPLPPQDREWDLEKVRDFARQLRRHQPRREPG